MATKDTPKYDPKRQYKVKLARKVELNGQKLHPGMDLRLSGKALNQLAPEDVTHADPV
jgi:hypothetical protein